MRSLLFFGLLFIGSFVHAQKVNTKPKAKLVLKISQEDGTNASGVAWDENTGYYYTVFAGNVDYPLEVFNGQGSKVQKKTTGADVRGLWYNSEEDAIQANGYTNQDILTYERNANGAITGEPISETTIESLPNDQSCLAFDDDQNLLLAWDGDMEEVVFYKPGNGEQKKTLAISLPKKAGTINYTSVIYTGIKGAELGLLDVDNKKVYLFNKKNGELTYTITLPEDAVVNDAFRFAYANGNIFLYDVDTRTWTGYKIAE